MKTRTKLRRGVCGILLNSEGLILVGERTHQKNQWQLPQGGIDSGETVLQALHREMAEEVGVINLAILKQTSEYISYTWPASVFADSKYGGQKHIYFLMDASHIAIESLPVTEEFGRFRWCRVAEVLENIVDWKKPSYIQAFQELGLLKE